MQIRRIDKEEFARWQNQIAELFNESVKINFPNGIVDTNYGETKCNEVYEYLKDGSAVVFAAEEDDDMLGWLWCHPIVRMGRTRLHIAEIAVKNKYRGKGIGQTLLKSAETFAEKNDFPEIELLVTVSNTSAFRLYQKENFETERLIMKKTIISKPDGYEEE